MWVQSHTAVLSIALLLWAGLAQSGWAQPPKPREQVLKEQLVEIPAGSIVEVKLENKQKLRGKLGAVSDAGFELQSVRDGKISTSNVAINEVRSIKAKDKGMATGWKIGLGVLAGIGAFVVILVVAAAANGWD
jgi:hypothetical protein